MEQLILFLISLALIFLLVFMIKNVSISLLVGTVFFGIITLGPRSLLESMSLTFIEQRTLLLITISVLIVYFVNLYSITKMIDASQNYIVSKIKRPRLLMMLVPAFIGLLPVAGGALLSAPFVDSMGSRLGLDPNKKSFINVWYRHTLLFVYPLNDVLILISVLASIRLSELIPLLILPMFIMIISGYFLALRAKVRVSLEYVHGNPNAAPIIPFIITISVSVILAFFMNLGLEGIAIGVAVGIAILIIMTRPEIHKLWTALKDRRMLTVTMLLYAAMLMRKLIMDTDVISQINSISSMFPKLLMLILMPFFLGSILGSATGALAISFAILSGIMGLTPNEVALVYGLSFLGYTMSPFHLCLIFSIEYLKGSLLKTYKYMVPACILTILSLLPMTFT